MKKKNYTTLIMWVIVLAIAIALVAVSFLEFYNLKRYVNEQKQQLAGQIVKIEENVNGETISISLDDYLSYYSELDRKATESINTVIAFVGSIFAITTIVNAVIAIGLPKRYEEEMAEVKKYAFEGKQFAQLTAIRDLRATASEKIDLLTEHIDNTDDVISDMFFYRAQLYVESKKYDEAIREFKLAHKKGHDPYLVYNSLGILYSIRIKDPCSNKELNRLSNWLRKAEESFERALKCDGISGEKKSNTYSNIACLYDYFCSVACKNADESNLNELSKRAEDYYHKSLAENERNFNSCVNFGKHLRQQGETHFEKAYEYFQQGFAINSEDVTLLALLIDTAIKLAHKDKSIGHMLDAELYSRILSEKNITYNFEEELDVLRQELYSDDKEARIAFNIAELSMEEYAVNPCENDRLRIIEEYNDALELYLQLYEDTSNEEYSKVIENIKARIDELSEE